MAAQPLGSLGSSADRNLLEVALKVGEHMRVYPSPADPPLWESNWPQQCGYEDLDFFPASWNLGVS